MTSTLSDTSPVTLLYLKPQSSDMKPTFHSLYLNNEREREVLSVLKQVDKFYPCYSINLCVRISSLTEGFLLSRDDTDEKQEGRREGGWTEQQ